MLKKRLLTTLAALPVFIGATWFGGWWFTALTAFAGLMAAWEFYRLVTKAKTPTMTGFGMVFVLLLIASPSLNYGSFAAIQARILVPGVIISLVWLLFLRQKDSAFASWAWTLGGVLYLGLLLSHVTALRGLDNGRGWVFFAVITNAFSDSAAYFAGRAWGRHHLAPVISPKKTWEGSAGGIIGAVISGIALRYILDLPAGFGIGQVIILSVLISLAGQVGDLVESLFKRNVGAKESSNLLPGHGGFLDRLDSVVFIGVLVYYYVIWLF